MTGKCDGCGREGIVGTPHTVVEVVRSRLTEDGVRIPVVTEHSRCGTFRRPEPAESEVTHTPRFCAEPETKDPLYPRVAAPKRLVGEEN